MNTMQRMACIWTVVAIVIGFIIALSEGGPLWKGVIASFIAFGLIAGALLGQYWAIEGDMKPIYMLFERGGG